MTRGVAGTAQGCGSNARYNAGCRCDRCRAAHTRHRNLARLDQMAGNARLLPAIGTERRLRALAAMGWSYTALGEHLGLTREAVAKLSWPRPSVERKTARRIEALYDQLCMTPGPSATAKARALAKGWPPPLAYDDIDDPDEVPDLGARSRGIDLDEWAYLVRNGEDPNRAAARMGVQITAIERAAHRAHRYDIRWMATSARKRAS